MEEKTGAAAAAAAADEIRRLPAEVNWEMLDKSRFFVLGAALFSGVSAALYPAVVVKTHLQVAPPPQAATATAAAILRREGLRGFYRGFGASLAGTVPARALYMAALETTKSSVGPAAVRLGFSEPAASTAASAAAGVSAAVAAQVVWTPVDVISQRLMVQSSSSTCRYRGGADAFRKILAADGVRGLYRGFGLSTLTYAPSNAVWWSTYAVAQRLMWRAVGPDSSESYAALVAVQGASAAIAGGASALVTMPLDTVKTRLQVMETAEASARPTMASTVRGLLKEGGWAACYRGLGPRWGSMSLSAATMVTTYEFLKRMSAKEGSFD